MKVVICDHVFPTIEQERIAGAVFPADLSEERKQAEDDLDRIEMKLRRI